MREGYEGDDVMAALGQKARSKYSLKMFLLFKSDAIFRGLKVIYCTDDKDLHQMIDDDYSYVGLSFSFTLTLYGFHILLLDPFVVRK